jgi:hypothetical protein
MKPEIKPLGEFGNSNEERLIRLLYDIYCRITNIEYFAYRSALENIGNINYIEILEIGTEPVPLLTDVSADRIIRIYNMSYDNPDILLVSNAKTQYGVPINSGESQSFTVRENKVLYGRYKNTVNRSISKSSYILFMG